MFVLILMIVQFALTIIMGFYFMSIIKDRTATKDTVKRNSESELRKLEFMNAIRLSMPLSEKTRPASLDDIIGQKNGIRALKAALCSPCPQHVIIYGPPGIGKTAAARLMLEEAKKSPLSPFRIQAKFIETDATIMRFDERNIADPLIGSVHDPIYQGAGAYGPAGIPQPKPGAVTKAHGGILFIDEIGELHPIQINKLLKVLEDRKVYLESAYYSQDDPNIPRHIHEIFKNGLPADFRLIGATTRSPEEIPPAIRSRCVEIFFDNLNQSQLCVIAANAIERGNFKAEDGVCQLISEYCANGRDAVNLVQIAGSLCMVENRNKITIKDVEWVIETSKYNRRPDRKITSASRIGCISGLAVTSGGDGIVIDLEAEITEGCGFDLGGLTEEECIEAGGRKLTRTSTAKSSVKNAISILKRVCDMDMTSKHIQINVPGGIPVDGPSAGIAIFSALYSAVNMVPVSSLTAMTGEISISGKISPVGGVAAKIQGAIEAGATSVIIPKSNWQKTFETLPIDIYPIENVNELLEIIAPANTVKMPSKLVSA